MTSQLSKKLKDVKIEKQSKEPLWKGPEGEGPNGGITQSMMNSWLSCKERFRVRNIEGWRGNEQWSKPMGYGNMWHVCEESLAESGNPIVSNPVTMSPWEHQLSLYVIQEIKKFPLQQEDIRHWADTCRAQFPEYVNYWRKHKDVEQRTPIFQEQVFDVPYELLSGRVVRLRGKFDSVDLIGKGREAGIYLQENKTKGDIDQLALQSQLLFDLQTMTYLVALQQLPEHGERGPGWENWTKMVCGSSTPIKGVRYNVIRRPFSGGRGSIKRKEPSKSNPQGESKTDFYKRLVEEYIRVEPEYWFMRWKSEVLPEDIKLFRDQCLDPMLEAICWWYDCQNLEEDYRPPTFHWRHPYGCSNSINEGYKSDVDEYIRTGSTVGLRRVETLFPELT